MQFEFVFAPGVPVGCKCTDLNDARQMALNSASKEMKAAWVEIHGPKGLMEVWENDGGKWA